MEFKFSKLVKAIVFRCLRAKKRLAVYSTANSTLHNWQGKQAFVKENDQKQKNEKKWKKEI